MGGGNRVKRRVVKQLIAIDTGLLLSYIRPQKTNLNPPVAAADL
jgi:hypothetical protein